MFSCIFSLKFGYSSDKQSKIDCLSIFQWGIFKMANFSIRKYCQKNWQTFCGRQWLLQYLPNLPPSGNPVATYLAVKTRGKRNKTSVVCFWFSSRLNYLQNLQNNLVSRDLFLLQNDLLGCAACRTFLNWRSPSYCGSGDWNMLLRKCRDSLENFGRFRSDVNSGETYKAFQRHLQQMQIAAC